MDEWGQGVCMGVLARYGRVMLPRPGWAGWKGEEEEGEENQEEEEGNENRDLKLLLDSVKPLLQSRNPAVFLSFF